MAYEDRIMRIAAQQGRERAIKKRDISDRQSYGLGNLKNRMKRANLDKRGWNREVLNRQYFGDRANRNTQSAINRLMDVDQSRQSRFSTGELFNTRNALNYITSLQKNRGKIDPMYLPSDDDMPLDEYPAFAHAIMNDPVSVARPGGEDAITDFKTWEDYQGSPVRPSDWLADPDYAGGNFTGKVPFANMGRGNPFLKDLAGYSTMANVSDEDFFTDIPGTGGQGMRWAGSRLDELDPTVRFEDQGYETVNPNPTIYDWEKWQKSPWETIPEKAVGTYGFGPDQELVERFPYSNMSDPVGRMEEFATTSPSPTGDLLRKQPYERGLGKVPGWMKEQLGKIPRKVSGVAGELFGGRGAMGNELYDWQDVKGQEGYSAAELRELGLSGSPEGALADEDHTLGITPATPPQWYKPWTYMWGPNAGRNRGGIASLRR